MVTIMYKEWVHGVVSRGSPAKNLGVRLFSPVAALKLNSQLSCFCLAALQKNCKIKFVKEGLGSLQRVVW